MKFKHLLIIGVVLSLLSIILVSAQDAPDLEYPIPELGNCESKSACKQYCDNEEHAEQCLDFAEQHHLLTEQEIERARKMLKLGEIEGPGSCQSKEECEVYCDNLDHIKECVQFAEQHNLLSSTELEEAKKVAQALEQGVEPPNCQGKAECDVYCSQPEHMKECIEFEEAAGIIPPQELKRAKMALKAIEQGIEPPPCAGGKACDEYCSKPAHIEQCVDFAEAAGFISSKEAELMRETGGAGPGGCRGEQACEEYCSQLENIKECKEFAEKYGLPSKKEQQDKNKLPSGVEGPGGCKTKTECEQYCKQPGHFEECLEFAVKIGEISKQEAQQMREKRFQLQQQQQQQPKISGPGGCSTQQECKQYCEDPAHAEECLEWSVREGKISPEEAEQMKELMEKKKQMEKKVPPEGEKQPSDEQPPPEE